MNKPQSTTVFKTTVLYTAATILRKTIRFLTIPIFARLLTKTEFGLFDTYTSWIVLISTVIVFDLPLSVIRAKNDVGEDMDSYAFSVLTLTTVTNGLFCILAILLKDIVITKWIGMEDRFIAPMFLYLFFSPALDVFAAKQRAFYKYKTYAITVLVSSIFVTLLSLLLAIYMSDKLAGRFYGYFYGEAIVGVVFYAVIAFQGRQVKKEYWKDSFTLCFPLMLHLVALYVLTASDKIMITKLQGADYTGVYAIAVSAAHIAAIVMHAMNSSWAPWMLDMLADKESEQLRKYSKPYILAFFAFLLACMLFAPEIVAIMGGKAYRDAVYLVPPLFAGTMFSFIYQMYLQTEFYEKKTKMIGIATAIAAFINAALNLLLIPVFGYAAAAYTTLIGYIFLLGFHFLYATKLGYRNVFSKKFIGVILAIVLLLTPVCLFLYDHLVLRVTFIGVVFAGVCCFAWKYKSVLVGLIKKKA